MKKLRLCTRLFSEPMIVVSCVWDTVELVYKDVLIGEIDGCSIFIQDFEVGKF